MNGILFLTTALLCLLTAIGILWLNSRRPINQAISLLTLFAASSFFCAYIVTILAADNPTAYQPKLLFWLRMSSAVYAFIPWTFWLMKDAIVTEHTSIFPLIRRSWIVFVISCVLAGICFTDSYIPADSSPLDPQRGMGYIFFSVSMYALIGSIVFKAYRAMRQTYGMRRIELQFFLLNACVVALLSIVFNVLRRVLHVPLQASTVPEIVIICLGVMAWAMSYHRIFDARQFMASSGQRLLMLAILASATLGFTRIFSPPMGPSTGLVLSVVFAGIIVFYCNLVTRKWLALDTDRLLAEPRAKIIEWARSESDPEKLRSLFENFLRNYCQTKLVEIIVAGGTTKEGNGRVIADQVMVRLCQQGWLTPEHLQRLRPKPAIRESLELMSRRGFAALIAAPRGSDVPSLIIALGSKHSLRPYTYPDITILLNLAELMDNTLSHANLSQHAAKIAQMESAAMMSRSLAHDLNNLTTPVATYLLHSQGRATPGSAEAEVYDAALHSIKVMHDYIRESLFFARRLIPEIKEVDPAECLVSVVRLAQERAAGREITLNPSCEAQTRFLADPVLFQRLALNLVHNAIDASPRGAAVTISIGVRSAEQICLTVSDQGVGIPAENIKRIFDPYFTTKDTGDTVRGLGLGLAICRKIADLHGGEIEVQSVPGQGSTFTVLFPQKRIAGVPGQDLRSSSFMNSGHPGRLGTLARSP